MSSSKQKSSGLMGDLESIKALLEEDDLDAAPEELSQALHPAPETDIPILVEPLNSFDPQTGVSTPVSEPVDQPEDEAIELESEDHIAAEELVDLQELEALDLTPSHSDRKSLVSHQSLDALLGEDFHDATAEVMQRARGLINQHATEWSPQQTDELADALRVRIDDAVAQWIQTSLAAHADELQQRLLAAVRQELAHHLDALERTTD